MIDGVKPILIPATAMKMPSSLIILPDAVEHRDGSNRTAIFNLSYKLSSTNALPRLLVDDINN